MEASTATSMNEAVSMEVVERSLHCFHSLQVTIATSISEAVSVAVVGSFHAVPCTFVEVELNSTSVDLLPRKKKERRNTPLFLWSSHAFRYNTYHTHTLVPPITRYYFCIALWDSYSCCSLLPK